MILSMSQQCSLPRLDRWTVSRRVGWGMAGVLLAVTLAALAAPWLRQGWLYQFFSTACHQMPGRCYSFDGHPTALCVRCLWLYLGLGLVFPHGSDFFANVLRYVRYAIVGLWVAWLAPLSFFALKLAKPNI